MTGPNFYNIDFAREVVLQGRSSTFITIERNSSVLSPLEKVYVLMFPHTRTFNSFSRGNIGPMEEGFSPTSGSFSYKSFLYLKSINRI